MGWPKKSEIWHTTSTLKRMFLWTFKYFSVFTIAEKRMSYICPKSTLKDPVLTGEETTSIYNTMACSIT